MNIEQIAKVAHELNRAYCASQGDMTQLSWEDAPDWQADSAIQGVKFHLANPTAEPSDSHESWLDQKTQDGWSYGEIKNESTKEHPCFVPYDQLPVAQKAKDYIFSACVTQLRPFIGANVRVA